MFNRLLHIFSFIFCANTALFAQNTTIDSLIESYRFEQALQVLETRYDGTQDSLARLDMEQDIVRCQNGISLLNFTDRPEVLAALTVSKEDFYLRLPLPDKSWRKAPNILLQNKRDDFPSAIYFPEGATSIFFTDKDESGSWNIYTTEKAAGDSVWTFPHLTNEGMTTSGNEIFPMLSPDGKTLYFASDALFGVGGYDIYVSRFDEANSEWGAPENLGFPYSSPHNDILYAISEDEKYSMLVSDRSTGDNSDSLTIFIMKYEPLSIKSSISNPDTLAMIARLQPAVSKEFKPHVEDPFGEDSDGYANLLKNIRQLRDSIASNALSLKNLRQTYDTLDSESEKSITLTQLERAEMRMTLLTDLLNKKNQELQKMEMDFLMSGMIIDPDEAIRNLNNKQEESLEKFVFPILSEGGPFELRVQRPVKRFDYSFKILSTGQFAEDNTIPDGLVYQIQIFATSAPAGVKNLKGLSPVFERKPSPGKYIYSVGLFDSYNDALSKLNRVKKQGFKSAFVIAFNNGERIDLQKARKMEKTPARQTFQICINAESLAPEVKETLQANNITKDIIRGTDNSGAAAYIIGPFDSEVEVNDISGKLIAAGVSGINIEKIQTDK